MEREVIERIATMMSSPDEELIELGENLLVASNPTNLDLADIFIILKEKRRRPYNENRLYSQLDENLPKFRI
jgi:hypothetical protein